MTTKSVTKDISPLGARLNVQRKQKISHKALDRKKETIRLQLDMLDHFEISVWQKEIKVVQVEKNSAFL